VEVVIAMAVTAFCLIVLIGMLPVGLTSARESRRETRAAYVAEQVASDLRASFFTNATILCQTNGALEPLVSFSLAETSTNCVTCDAQGNVLAAVPANQYASPVIGTSANYLVQVTVEPTGLTNLSTVFVEVSAPAQGALSARSRYGFETMIGNRQ